jgi:ataxia telangiectasia mutated family protein
LYSIDHIVPFLNGREYLFDTIRRNEEIRKALALTPPQSLLLEARVVRQSLQVARHHPVSQFSLSRATYLSQLAERAAKVGIQIEAAAQFDLARTFWDQGEMSAAVKIMQHIRDQHDLEKQDIPVDRSEILADLVSICEFSDVG